MKLTKRAGYGLRFLVLLAREPERFRSARDLAEQEGLICAKSENASNAKACVNLGTQLQEDF